MVVGIIFLWFLTSLIVLGYGVSNNAVIELGWPRWTTAAIIGIGCLMLVTMFVGMGAAAVTNIPGNWHLSSQFGQERHGNGD